MATDLLHVARRVVMASGLARTRGLRNAAPVGLHDGVVGAAALGEDGHVRTLVIIRAGLTLRQSSEVCLVERTDHFLGALLVSALELTVDASTEEGNEEYGLKNAIFSGQNHSRLC